VPASTERRAAAVVTGASSGIGRALAVRFAATVEQLVLIGRDRARLDAVARQAESQGAQVSCHVTRLDAPAELDALALALGKLPALSALLHAAGEYASDPVAASKASDFDRLLAVNLRAPYVLTRALLDPLQRGSGDIVFINSSAAGQRRAELSAYGASKAGLVAFADSLRQECNPLGLRVLSVFLGATATPLQAHIHARAGRRYEPTTLLQAEDVAAIVHAALALPRGAEVTDLHLRPAAAHRAG